MQSASLLLTPVTVPTYCGKLFAGKGCGDWSVEADTLA